MRVFGVSRAARSVRSLCSLTLSLMKYAAALLILPAYLFGASVDLSGPSPSLMDTPPFTRAQGEEVTPRPTAANMPAGQSLPALSEVKTTLRCDDNTEGFFNRSGIEVIPFARPTFFDMDGDGRQEMILGTKEGSILLYKNSGLPDIPAWGLVRGYFHGIAAGVFASPAAGDIDGDGKPEILVGTGGFSTDSGKVLIYQNQGSIRQPLWERIPAGNLKVGYEASPVLVDLDQDGRLDIVAGNSSGSLFLFRNRTRRGRISFSRDAGYFRGLNLGLYAVPAATNAGRKPVIIAGNSMGKLYLLKREYGKKPFWRKEPLSPWISSFASPAFIQPDDSEIKDLVVADGNGQIHYFKNRDGNYRAWDSAPNFVAGRMMPGPACAPSMTCIRDRAYMVVGNLYGEFRLYEYDPSSAGMPWTRRQGFFKGIQLPGFSRGVLAQWDGRELLVAGHENGLTAFLNTGTFERPEWTEQKDFFKFIPKIVHAAPAVFDIDGDGAWELLVGDANGDLHGFRYLTEPDGKPVWERISGCFSEVKVDRFATPALAKNAGMLYLLVGQQDGRVRIFAARAGLPGLPYFHDSGYMEGFRANTHSSPSAVSNDKIIELAVGDYHGNLKHFICRPASGE